MTTWRRILHYWPHVNRTHRSLVDFPHKEPTMWTLMSSLLLTWKVYYFTTELAWKKNGLPKQWPITSSNRCISTNRLIPRSPIDAKCTMFYTLVWYIYHTPIVYPPQTDTPSCRISLAILHNPCGIFPGANGYCIRVGVGYATPVGLPAFYHMNLWIKWPLGWRRHFSMHIP